jgi:hypothetical protein
MSMMSMVMMSIGMRKEEDGESRAYLSSCVVEQHCDAALRINDADSIMLQGAAQFLESKGSLDAFRGSPPQGIAKDVNKGLLVCDP